MNKNVLGLMLGTFALIAVIVVIWSVNETAGLLVGSMSGLAGAGYAKARSNRRKLNTEVASNIHSDAVLEISDAKVISELAAHGDPDTVDRLLAGLEDDSWYVVEAE